MEKKKKIKVIFRAWTFGGEVIALFPEIAVDTTGYLCQSYMRVGQHGAASPDIVNDTRPAIPDEYKALYDELVSLGYDLKVIKKFSYKHQQTRMNTYK